MHNTLRQIILLFLGLTILISCTTKKTEQIKLIKSKYSIKSINTFYELCFNEKNEDCRVITKWEKNIYYYYEGDTITGDHTLFEKVYATINALNLPIKISEATSRKEANLVIKRGSEIQLGLERPNRGVAMIHSKGGIIDSVKILLSNQIFRNQRTSVLLHEFIHALGFRPHITTDSKSLMFQFYDKIQILNEEEIEAIKILYEPNWPENYSYIDFERDFGDCLYNVYGKYKFAKYLKYNEVNKKVIDEILLHGLIKLDSLGEPQIFKHANSLMVLLKGDVPPGTIDTLKMVIDAINGATQNFQLRLTNDTSIIYGITVNLIKDKWRPKDQITLKPYNLLITDYKFITFIKTDLEVHYNELNGRSLGNLLYQAICLKDFGKTEPFEYNEGKIQLKPLYKKVLEVYYAYELPHNFKKSELEEVLKKMK